MSESSEYARIISEIGYRLGDEMAAQRDEQKCVWGVAFDRTTGEMKLVSVLVLRDHDGVIELASKHEAFGFSRTFAARDPRVNWTREEAVAAFVEKCRKEAEYARQSAEQAQAVYEQALSFERETIGATEQASV